MKKSNSDVKVKTRYGKFRAYLLFNSSLALIECPLFLLFAYSSGKNMSEYYYLITTFMLGLIFLVLITLSINAHTPKDERVATWFRAWGLGFKVTFKLALCSVLIFIPFVLAHRSSISQKDYYFWNDGDIVKDDDGIEHKVVGGGSFVEYNGNWHKIYHISGEPYIEDGLRKIWLKNR